MIRCLDSSFFTLRKTQGNVQKTFKISKLCKSCEVSATLNITYVTCYDNARCKNGASKSRLNCLPINILSIARNKVEKLKNEKPKKISIQVRGLA